MGTVDKVTEEGGAEVAAGMETGKDEIMVSGVEAFSTNVCLGSPLLDNWRASGLGWVAAAHVVLWPTLALSSGSC